MGNMANGATAVQPAKRFEVVRPGSLVPMGGVDPQLAPPKHHPWLIRRCQEAGFITMADETSTPPPVINWTKITTSALYVFALIALMYFTWQAGEQSGVRLEKARAEREQLEGKMAAEKKLLEDKIAAEDAAKQKQIDDLKKEIRILQEENKNR